MSLARVIATVPALVLSASVSAQERLELDLIPALSLFEWSGTSNTSGLAAPKFDPTYRWEGGFELEVTEGPNGPRARFDGADIVFAPDIVGTTITALFGQVEFEDARITLTSTAFDLAPFVPFQTDLTLTFTGGNLNVISPSGPAHSMPLAGSVIGTIPVSGSMGITALGEFQINVSLFAFQLDFAASGFEGVITSTGFIHADLDCPLVSPYCVSATNSIGTQARINIIRRPSVSENDLSLRALFLPGNRPGLFFSGPDQIQAPFGDGFQCVGGQVFRLPVVVSNAVGQAVQALDVTLPPSPAGRILPGSTWNFQFWYRDPGGPGGSGFNLTDAASVFFCP